MAGQKAKKAVLAVRVGQFAKRGARIVSADEASDPRA
jgi:hypothetical protein